MDTLRRPAADLQELSDHDELIALKAEVRGLQGWVRSIDGRLWLILITSLGALIAGLAHR